MAGFNRVVGIGPQRSRDSSCSVIDKTSRHWLVQIKIQTLYSNSSPPIRSGPQTLGTPHSPSSAFMTQLHPFWLGTLCSLLSQFGLHNLKAAEKAHVFQWSPLVKSAGSLLSSSPALSSWVVLQPLAPYQAASGISKALNKVALLYFLLLKTLLGDYLAIW